MYEIISLKQNFQMWGKKERYDTAWGNKVTNDINFFTIKELYYW